MQTAIRRASLPLPTNGPGPSVTDAGSRQWVYPFRAGGAEHTDLLGSKAAHLAEMTSIGLPVPPGFTITTEACREYYRRDERLPGGLVEQVRSAMTEL